MQTVDPYDVDNLEELQIYYDDLRFEYEDLQEEYNSLINDYDEIEKDCANYKYLYEKLEQENYILESGITTTSNSISFFEWCFIFMAIAFVLFFFIGPFINFDKYKK